MLFDEIKQDQILRFLPVFQSFSLKFNWLTPETQKIYFGLNKSKAVHIYNVDVYTQKIVAKQTLRKTKFMCF